MTDLALLVDRMELRDLAERYARCADERDGEGFAGVFAVDGVLATGRRTFEGRADIVKVADILASTYAKTMHFVGNHYADVKGDEATGMTYCLAHHLYERDGEERDTLMVIRYADRCVRTDEGWRFANRALSIDWLEDRPLTVRAPGA